MMSKIYSFSRLHILLLFILGILLSCSGSKKVGEVQKEELKFEDTDLLSEAITIAEIRDQPVFIDFYTTWCLPCRIMDEEVFSQKGVYDYFNDNFVNLKVNAEAGNGPKLRFLFDIKGYPTFVFVDHKGKVLVQHQGSLTYTGILNKAKEAKAIFESQKEDI